MMTTTTTNLPCPVEVGSYSLSGSCGATLDVTVKECIKPQAAGSCVHNITATGGLSNGTLGVSGTVDVDGQGNFNQTILMIDGASQQGCDGTWTGPTPGTLAIKCNGGCNVTLTRTAATCP